MKISNKARFWLGLRCVARRNDEYVITRRFLGLFREYYDAGDNGWWGRVYSGSLFDTQSEALAVFQKLGLHPVDL